MIHNSIDYRGDSVDIKWIKKFEIDFVAKANSLLIYDLSVEPTSIDDLHRDQIVISQDKDHVSQYTNPQKLFQLLTWTDEEMKKIGFSSITPYIILSNDEEDPYMYQFFEKQLPKVRRIPLESENEPNIMKDLEKAEEEDFFLKTPYEHGWGFQSNKDPILLDNSKIVCECPTLIFFPSRIYSDFDVGEAIEKKGTKVSENVIVVYDRGIKSRKYSGFAFRIKSKSSKGFTLYELGRAIYDVHEYTDLRDHHDGNTCVYEIRISKYIKGSLKDINEKLIMDRMKTYNAHFMTFSANS